jgi:thiamine biosynthesis lipoprotein
MHRRDFLHPRHLATTAGHVLGALDVLPEPTPDATDEMAVVRLGWRAMATGFEIILPFDTPEALAAGQQAFELLDAIEDRLTVYRDHSEMCRVNRLAAARPVRASAELFQLLRLAARISAETEGTFDVTAGALIKAWGFFRGPRRVPPEAERALALECVGMRHVVLDEAKRSVRYRRPGLEINLGSIGKGYALDRLAELLGHRWNLRAALLHGGSSSVYAKGGPCGDRRGWGVRIRHPWKPGRYLATVWLRDRGLGTSAATFQHLVHQGKKLGHVLDPRTGWPASGVASASAVAPTGAEADALSTAFYVGGVEAARRYVEGHPGVGAVLLPEGETRPLVFGLAAHEYTILETPPRDSPGPASCHAARRSS